LEDLVLNLDPLLVWLCDLQVSIKYSQCFSEKENYLQNIEKAAGGKINTKYIKYTVIRDMFFNRMQKKPGTFTYSETCLIRPGKCVGVYRISNTQVFILVNRNTLGPQIFVKCHRMSDNSGVGLHLCSTVYISIILNI
jgi:hypothetical protein